jgi:Fe-S cluster assembly protein SufD
MSATVEASREREVPTLSPARDHAPRVVSRDPADFAVPTGREEEWRFTPLRRFATLLAGEPSDAHLAWTSSVPAGVEVD